METTAPDTSSDMRLAERIRTLRKERGWSLDDIAERSRISRATLSRLENGQVSPSANLLGKLCAAYGLTMSRLMRMVEEDFVPLVRRSEQMVWRDAGAGFHRRSVSPPAQPLAGEALECTLDPDARIVYDVPPRPGLEHHLILLEGRLSVRLDGRGHDLLPGDCLRYQLFGPSTFATGEECGARYILFIV